ncbi:MAG: hypothetical protein QY323_02770 [Patescibacteria group bacterium]|nr:MAG: hypothetical protein QY323_02770 [Patescibacteria group bacterium]
MRTIAFFFLLCCLTAATAEAGRKKKPPKTVSPPTLVEMIARAKKKLAGQSVGTSKVGGDNAVLAVWKPGTAKLAVVKVRKGRSVTKGYRVTLLKRNGVNSEYRVDAPSDFVVLAIKTNVKKRPLGRKRRSVAVIYAPYGAHLDTAEMRRRGRAYLHDIATRAIAKLQARDVRSRTDPDTLVTAMVDERVLLTLLVIEHIDPPDFDARGAEATANRVLSLIGANQGDAYDHAFSDADAGGLAQFRPKTYAEIRDDYPDAKLKAEFYAGVRDHINGVMAQYCYVDFTLARLDATILKRLQSDANEQGAYLAAAYNHGLYGAAKIIAKHPDAWDKPGNGFSKANLQYVKEFRAVYRYLW